jgi:hypothetical protein
MGTRKVNSDEAGHVKTRTARLTNARWIQDSLSLFHVGYTFLWDADVASKSPSEVLLRVQQLGQQPRI